MKNKSIKPRGEEEIRNENEFLKMKLMLERGAVFGPCENEGLPPEVENQFLNYIAEFEKQSDNPVQTTVFKKIGSPQHFPKVETIPDAEIDNEWEKLEQYLQEHGVDMGCCSPNVSTRELYRFTTEELFKLEISDVNIPGMICGFIYDEFYPDHKYQNSRSAVEDLIDEIFSKEELLIPEFKFEKSITLNDYRNLSFKEFIKMINQFRESFDAIELKNADASSCEIVDKHCVVTGTYEAELIYGGNKETPRGNWTVDFIGDDEGYWSISQIRIENVFIKHG